MRLGLGTLISLPAGEVTLHDARRSERRTVRVEAFALSRTSVTEGSTDLPLSGVTWFEAVRICNLVSEQNGLPPAYEIADEGVRWDVTSDGYRLPTEAEWEYGCRAGTSGPHYGPLEEIAWTALDATGSAQRVALKRPNAFGLHDMLGNVWEWCWDYLDTARYGDYRVFRGGDWAAEPWNVRASVRRGSAPDAVMAGTGLRVARGGLTTTEEVQGWSARRDQDRAAVTGALPVGWTPLRPI
ncbi:formylglycine-generating enzyme family protein [Micrococcus terreus]|uniref:formylglycine-generating enzyme family protein n=1 Tax=Actinomycetes TaxID=1760 RepID=UPI0021A38041|nr:MULTISPECIES: formylglycine-generating enzyme family protein [Actinomycetes]MCT2090318.1 formylglycine-generating enzyme family protein [Micrococcus terreus]